MSVQKQEVGSVGVKVGVNVVLLCHRRFLSVVKKPDERMRRRQGGHFDVIARTAPIDQTIEAVMEKVGSIASPLVGWTEPDRSREGNGGIGAPRQFVVAGKPDHVGEIDIPAKPGCAPIWRAV